MNDNQHIAAVANTKTGKVILAGAGCGDPGLITVKAARYLQQADIVLTDRLVSDELLKQYVHQEAEIIRGQTVPAGLLYPTANHQ